MAAGGWGLHPLCGRGAPVAAGGATCFDNSKAIMECIRDAWPCTQVHRSWCQGPWQSFIRTYYYSSIINLLLLIYYINVTSIVLSSL